MSIIKMHLTDGFIFRNIWPSISVRANSCFYFCLPSIEIIIYWFLAVINNVDVSTLYQISNSDSVRHLTLILKKIVNRSESSSRNSRNHWDVVFITYSETVSNPLNPSNTNVLFPLSAVSLSWEHPRSKGFVIRCVEKYHLSCILDLMHSRSHTLKFFKYLTFLRARRIKATNM